jgi:hypothetical protein
MVASSRRKRVGLQSALFHPLYSTFRNSVDAQWITAKKDWQDEKRRQKTSNKLRENHDTASPEAQTDTGDYEEEMDEMRCILYSHGGPLIRMMRFSDVICYLIGGYYFGSVDQER